MATVREIKRKIKGLTYSFRATLKRDENGKQKIMLDYCREHFCPVYNRTIDPDLCYESLCCLGGLFKTTSVPELKELKNIDSAKEVCSKCKYSDLGSGMDDWDRKL